MFSPYPLGMWQRDDSSSEAHLQSSKICRGSYLDPEFFKIFEFSRDPVLLVSVMCATGAGKHNF